MNAKWSEIKVGDRASLEVAITPELVAKFVDISGDDNRLHLDDSFARQKGFARRIVHGLLLASLFSKIVGKFFFGDENLYLAQTITFRKPVFVGDIVKVEGLVKNKIESVRILHIETTVNTPDGEVALSGEAQVTYKE